MKITYLRFIAVAAFSVTLCAPFASIGHSAEPLKNPALQLTPSPKQQAPHRDLRLSTRLPLDPGDEAPCHGFSPVDC